MTPQKPEKAEIRSFFYTFAKVASRYQSLKLTTAVVAWVISFGVVAEMSTIVVVGISVWVGFGVVTL